MGKVRVMGIVNVTPDSFSGDGLIDANAAIARGMAMAIAGADIVDVGGESTRPGHEPVSVDEEIHRALPVVEALALSGLTVSIDTYKLEVARAAADAGATIVNDIWGLQRSPEIANLVAERGLGLILMHNQDGTDYAEDLITVVKRRLSLRAAAKRAEGMVKRR